ncbi:unnamed protein product [Tenebrio molitor]|nr:unnamed protein product [Tenebrio molitor]
MVWCKMNFSDVLNSDKQGSEIKTRSVERQLRPLVIHVTTLVKSETPRKKKGKLKSMDAIVLVTAVERAIKNFIEKGEQIANENPDFSKEMLAAVEEVRTTGNAMSVASREFAQSPCDSQKRNEMVKAARNLLSAVTRLLILADMIDVQLLLKSIQVVEDNLENVRNAKNPDELAQHLKLYNRNARELLTQAGRRQQELTDPRTRDDLAAARAVLKTSHTMLLTASRAYLAHPDVPAAKDNRDRVLKQVCEAVSTINDVAQGRTPKLGSGIPEGPGKLATSFDKFDTKGGLNYNEVRTKAKLQQQLEELINGAILISEADNIKDERKQRIVDGCNAVREALQGLLTHSMKTAGGTNKEVDRAMDTMTRKTRDLRRQLRKALTDRISDSFLGPNTPLLAMVKAAESGNAQEVETCATAFNEHCKKLFEVANQVCEMSNNEDGIKMVRYAAAQLENLRPGVISAAKLLAVQPHSSAAKKNMEVFQQQWESQMQLLLDAVDDITTVDDVLSVLENNVFDDINQYLTALQEHDPAMLSRIRDSIQGRSNRICDVVTAEMDNFEPCTYTKRVLEAIKVLNEEIIPEFNKKTEMVVQDLVKTPNKEIDENEFIDATRLVYDGVREVRRAVLLNRADEDLDPEEVELEHNYVATNTLVKSIVQTNEITREENSEEMSGITVVREAMSKLPEEKKHKIMEQVEKFQDEKLTFDREVDKWDDHGNDIVALAKYMCIIMMQMTDFIRQRGPLKSTADVIHAAKNISTAGTKLDKLTRQIAEQCPESSSKKDLLAYIERVALYSHQINIIAKVKADVQNTNEDLIVASVESATSLIENAKNLMNAVVLTVKASYVASTKYSRQATSSTLVVWKMKAPKKKPLVRLEKPTEVRAIVRKASQKKPQNPVKVLSEFHTSIEIV